MHTSDAVGANGTRQGRRLGNSSAASVSFITALGPFIRLLISPPHLLISYYFFTTTMFASGEELTILCLYSPCLLSHTQTQAVPPASFPICES